MNLINVSLLNLVVLVKPALLLIIVSNGVILSVFG